MGKWIVMFLHKYKDMILYIFFGLCTMIVNIITYWLSAKIFSSVVINTIVAWLIAVLFAYLTNRKFVFDSEAKTLYEIIAESMSFFSCRLMTGIFDVAVMWFFVDILNFNDVVIKTESNIIVILLNYAASKFVIFRKRRT